MTPEERASVKKAHLDLLDLIIKCREQELLGKLGETHIPKLELDAIHDLKFETSIKVLHKDGILGIIEKDGKKLSYDIERDENSETIIVECLKTAEEMTAYKNSLIIEDGWLSVQVIPNNTPAGVDGYLITRRNQNNKTAELSINEGELLVYLLTGNNIENSREKISEDTGLKKSQVSSLKNVIRAKLKRLDFSKEEVEEMLSKYNR